MNIEEIAQGVANSFYAMQAGYMPTEPWEMPTPSSGDMQIAADLMPLVKRAQAEAWSEGHAHGEFYADDPIAFQDNPYADIESEAPNV